MEAYIVAAKRTAGGRRGGRLSSWHPVDLGGFILKELVEQSKIDPALIEDVIFGCVTQVAEQAGNIARGAILAGGLPESVPGTSIDRQCGSSQQALHFAAATVMSGTMDVVVAGGVESMSRVPMGLSLTLPMKHGFGGMISHGIEARYPAAVFDQFHGAEAIAAKYQLDRDVLDDFAYDSHRKAIAATEAGKFEQEIVAVPVDDMLHAVDEGIRFDASRDGIANVKLLRDNGRLTAASSSQICDGAAALLVVNERGLKKTGLEPLARVHHMTVAGGDPIIMLETPIPATRTALEKAQLTKDDIDLFEVNEAFASIPLAWQRALDVDPSRINVRGGAIALGHPLGASGARIMTSLVHALIQDKKRYGLQVMCEGGGLANVTIVEALA